MKVSILVGSIENDVHEQWNSGEKHDVTEVRNECFIDCSVLSGKRNSKSNNTYAPQ